MEYWLTRLCFQKALAVIYFVAFLICYKQFVALVGKSGILPASSYTRYQRFKEAPSLFLFWKSDGAFRLMSVVGLVLSLVAFTGISEQHGFFISAAVWCSLWFIYMSFVNVGGLFYSFGWEILLLETGFLAIFLGSYDIEPSPVIIWLLRFVLFKIMFGAGLIKLRADSCWKNLTSMFFHYETQPLPGPLSRFFHRLPPSIHKIEVLFTHFVELIVPFGLFWPSGVRITAGILTAFFQFVLMLSGNLSWLNHITFILCISCLDDHFLSHFISFQPTRGAAFSFWYSALTYVVALFLLYLNYKPIRNLLSKQQIMNCSFDPCHLANTYGAFGTVTRVRREVIIEGTSEAALTPATKWEEYAFKAKPGDPHKRPPQVAPYNHKLDWQIWFAAMGNFTQHPWILRFILRLLEGEKSVLLLLKKNPFPEKPPTFIKASLYEYHFASPENRKRGLWWERRYLGPYISPLSLEGALGAVDMYLPTTNGPTS